MPIRRETFEQLLLACGVEESMGDFAEAAGVGRATMFRLLNGHPARRPTILRVAKRLKVEPERVLAAIEASARSAKKR